MTVHIALLRAINVANHNRVAMRDLLEMLTALGFEGGQSLLQSGNLVFQGGSETGALLESLLETESARRLSLHTDYLVRTAAQWQTVIARNPFPDQATHDPAHLVVMFLKSIPGTTNIATLHAAIRGPELAHVDGRHAYIVYPAGIGRSKLTVKFIEDALDTRGTGRNWNTVLKLADLAT